MDTVSRKALKDEDKPYKESLCRVCGCVDCECEPTEDIREIKEALKRSEQLCARGVAVDTKGLRYLIDQLAAERAGTKIWKAIAESYKNELHREVAENKRLRAALKKLKFILETEQVDAFPIEDCIPIVDEALSSPIKGDAVKGAPTWEPIHNSFFQDFRCLVSDGDGFYMGGYMGGQWYADEMAPILSEEITHFMIVSPPGITEGGGNDV